MKKSIIIILVLICALAVISCGRVEAQQETVQATPVPEQTEVVAATQEAVVEPVVEQASAVEQAPIAASVIQAQPQQETSPAQEVSSGCTVEGNGIKFEVKTATIEQSYTGEDMAVVYGVYTNNNSAGDSYWNVISDSASQNGSTLGIDVVVDYSKIANATETISNGQSIPITLCYRLNDANAPITVSISIFNDRPENVVASGSCTLNFT